MVNLRADNALQEPKIPTLRKGRSLPASGLAGWGTRKIPALSG